MITSDIIINLLLILSVAWVLGIMFSHFGLPAMLGELLAGIILGPPLLGIVIASPVIEMLAELGIFFVMFHSGMEMDSERTPRACLAFTRGRLSRFCPALCNGIYPRKGIRGNPVSGACYRYGSIHNRYRSTGGYSSLHEYQQERGGAYNHRRSNSR